MKFSIMAIAAALALTAPAQATPYQFLYSGGGDPTTGFSASLFLDIASGSGAATFTQGSRNGVNITGLSTFSRADNLLSLVSPYVDRRGISYTTTGGQNFNVSLNGTNVFESTLIDSPYGQVFQGSTVTSETLIAQTIVTPLSVPEPMSMAIMGAGLIAMGSIRLKGRSAVNKG